MKIEKMFNHQASDILKNPELNKREMEIFLDGLLQGYLALGEGIEEWSAVQVEAEKFRAEIRGL